MAKSSAPRPSGTQYRSALPHIPEWLFFSVSVFYMELLMQILVGWQLNFSRFVFLLLFSMATGLLIGLVALLLSPWRYGPICISLILTALTVLFCTQYFLNTSYQTFMNLSSITAGAGGVATQFGGIAVQLIFKGFWVIFLFFLPLFAYCLIDHGKGNLNRLTLLRCGCYAASMLICFGIAVFGATHSADRDRYKSQYNFDAACHTFGIITACRLDTKYAIFGKEEEIAPIIDESDTPKESETPSGKPSADGENPDEEAKPVVYGYNKMDIDFESKLAETSDDTLTSIHNYVNASQPSKQNPYTGLFKGKNLIFITAEAFSKEVISQKYTPTLYRLANKGFVFEDYYQPAWGGSTSTGEYSNLMGLIPTDGVSSIQDTIGHNNYFTMGNQLQRLGYFSAAYHNGEFDYYSRNKTHTNMGYSTFTGMGNGMEEGVTKMWPESDQEMFNFTLDQYIDKQPFSIYYMSISGHCLYSTSGNSMSKKNIDAVADMDASDTVKAYIASNLELEYALQDMVAKLEQAGIADDTVIVLGTDHYPYGLEKSDTWGNTQDYLSELYGYTSENHITQDHSALIIWSGCLEDPDFELERTVSTPTYSLDILPTLSNLFGLEYDSRLLVGRDVFSNTTPLVIWPDYSWLTDKGYFNGSFTPNEGVTVDDEYISRIKSMVGNKFLFSKAVLNYDYYKILFGTDDVT